MVTKYYEVSYLYMIVKDAMGHQSNLKDKNMQNFLSLFKNII